MARKRKTLSGAKIKYVRAALGLTVNELAELLELSPRTIERMESEGARAYIRLALVGLLVTREKPFGYLWPR